MVINIIRVALIVILSATTYASCNKNCVENIYAFNMDIRVYPDEDSININDTIWLEINSPVTLKDLNTGNMIDYSNAENLGTAISIVELIGGSISEPGGKAAVTAFDYKLVTGEELPTILPEQNKGYNFSENQGVYSFKLGVIAKKKGIYAFGISNAVNVFRKNNKCTKASFFIKLKDTDNHLYFLTENRPGYIPSGLDLTNVYNFKVK